MFCWRLCSSLLFRIFHNEKQYHKSILDIWDFWRCWLQFWQSKNYRLWQKVCANRQLHQSNRRWEQWCFIVNRFIFNQNHETVSRNQKESLLVQWYVRKIWLDRTVLVLRSQQWSLSVLQSHVHESRLNSEGHKVPERLLLPHRFGWNAGNHQNSPKRKRVVIYQIDKQ